MLAPATAKADEFTPAQKAELEKMMEEVILKNGENILKAVNQYQADLQERDRKEASKKAAGFLEDLKDEKNLPMAGNKDGDITIVEFFDYNCGYCRQALEELQTVLKEDKNVKVIFFDMPILGPNSRDIAKWALAAHKQGKYFEFHQAIFEHNGEKNKDTLIKLAEDVGLDVKKLRKDKESDEIAETIDEHIATANTMNIRGTPGFIIGDQVYPGFMEAPQILEIIADLREKRKK
jgi:protein-disulfide isomerase